MTKMNQSCKVCGEPAAGFHFGAFTCEGCKSFFGRTYNNLSSIQECKNNGKCVIDKKNRTSCKACRLRKCLMVGMSKSGSRYGRRSNWFKIHCLLQEQANLKSPLPPSVFEGAFGTPVAKECGVPDHTDGTKSPSAGSHESFASEASVDSTEKASNSSLAFPNGGGSASPLSPTYESVSHRDYFLRPPSLSPAVSPVFAPSLFPHQQRFFFPYAASGYSWAKLHLFPKSHPTEGLLDSQAVLFGHAFERFKGQPEQEKPIDLSVKGVEEEIKDESSSQDDSDEDEDVKEADACPMDKEVAPLDLTKPHTV